MEKDLFLPKKFIPCSYILRNFINFRPLCKFLHDVKNKSFIYKECSYVAEPHSDARKAIDSSPTCRNVREGTLSQCFACDFQFFTSLGVEWSTKYVPKNYLSIYSLTVNCPATPKSASLACPSEFRRILPALISLWIFRRS